MLKHDASRVSKEELLANCRQAIRDWSAARGQSKDAQATAKPTLPVGAVGSDVDFGR